MTALVVYLQNTVFRLKERQEGQTMAEYALILGGIAVVVIAAIVFLGGRITDLFRATGSSITNPVGVVGHGYADLRRPPGARSASGRPPRVFGDSFGRGRDQHQRGLRRCRTRADDGLRQFFRAQSEPCGIIGRA